MLLLALATTLAAPALAHRSPGALTTIAWNATSGQTEIVHRLHSHDAELGIGAVLGLPDLSLLDMEARAQAALYVEGRFAIADASGELKLTLVGAELEGAYLLVYQEYRPRLAGRIRVRSDMLREVFDTQVNLVNIEDNGAVHTLTFDEETWLEYQFSD